MDSSRKRCKQYQVRMANAKADKQIAVCRAAVSSECIMQNAKCLMIVSASPTIEIIFEENTSILHSAF